MFSNPRSSYSLEQTLQWTLGVLIFFALVLLIAVATWIGREAALQLVTARLEHDAEAIIAGVNLRQKTIKRILPPIYTQPFSGHYYVLVFPDGMQTRSRSLWDTGLTVNAAITAGEMHSGFIQGPQKQKLFYRQGTYKKQGQVFTILIAEDVSTLLSAVQQFFWSAMVIAVITATIILFTQKYLLRRGFSRLDRVRKNVSDIATGSSEILDSDVPVEIGPLVTEFNQLLTTWKAHLERSRNATGNLAHALKSPLNLIYQYSKERKDSEIAAQAERIQQLLSSELDRARLAGSTSTGQRFFPEKDIPDLVDTIQLLHRDKALAIETEINTPACLPYDQSDMLELFGNILDNAAKWADRRVKLQLSVNESIRIRLDDDGPGIAPELCNRLLTRGSRLDENAPGHGLGLSIVSEIVQLYKGSIELQQSDELGGLSVRITLPAKLSSQPENTASL